MRGSYIDQAKKVLRSFKKLPASNPSDKLNIEAKDNYYHFFLDAFSLKDWIKNDKKLIKRVRDDVEIFFSSKPTLEILRNLGNSIKHLKLKREPNRYKNVDFDIEFVTDFQGNKKKLLNVNYIEEGYLLCEDGSYLLLESGGKIIINEEENNVNARKLALKVLANWNKFFLKHNLKAGYTIVPRT